MFLGWFDEIYGAVSFAKHLLCFKFLLPAQLLGFEENVRFKSACDANFRGQCKCGDIRTIKISGSDYFPGSDY